MAVRGDWTPNEVLKADDLNDTFASKLDLAGGTVLQIVRATDSTERATTSTSYVDVTGMSVTITPQKSDSVVIIAAIFYGQTEQAVGGSVDNLSRYQITDSSDNAISGAQDVIIGTQNYTSTASGYQFIAPVNVWGYATPATTSAVTYKLRFMANNANITASVRSNLFTGQMYAIEVSA